MIKHNNHQRKAAVVMEWLLSYKQVEQKGDLQTCTVPACGGESHKRVRRNFATRGKLLKVKASFKFSESGKKGETKATKDVKSKVATKLKKPKTAVKGIEPKSATLSAPVKRKNLKKPLAIVSEEGCTCETKASKIDQVPAAKRAKKAAANGLNGRSANLNGRRGQEQGGERRRTAAKGRTTTNGRLRSVSTRTQSLAFTAAERHKAYGNEKEWRGCTK
ncbi:hypothetical protein M5K25_022104 [Dendrobium thyrsiflorum]|uniref:DUF4817 domain-containing protein n=1 Tax=Dendrobium thyrsiflorum TaxID=117978 RepID=A0ABD0U5J6_DENTH